MISGCIFMTTVFCHVVALLWVALLFRYSQVWLIHHDLYSCLCLAHLAGNQSHIIWVSLMSQSSSCFLTLSKLIGLTRYSCIYN